MNLARNDLQTVGIEFVEKNPQLVAEFMSGFMAP
jgi:hypothetical protein